MEGTLLSSTWNGMSLEAWLGTGTDSQPNQKRCSWCLHLFPFFLFFKGKRISFLKPAGAWWICAADAYVELLICYPARLPDTALTITTSLPAKRFRDQLPNSPRLPKGKLDSKAIVNRNTLESRRQKCRENKLQTVFEHLNCFPFYEWLYKFDEPIIKLLFDPPNLGMDFQDLLSFNLLIPIVLKFRCTVDCKDLEKVVRARVLSFSLFRHALSALPPTWFLFPSSCAP